ncbi:hypothetical protein WDW89_13625 [Deltaproteobacteria bacterium TL4]
MPLLVVFIFIISTTSVFAQSADYNTPVMTLKNRAPVYATAESTEVQSRLSFMETLWTCRPCVTAEHKGRIKTYYYDAAEENEANQYKVRGFLDKEELLLNRTALKEENTDILKKVVLSNNPAQHKKGEKLDKIPVRYAPDKDSKIEAELGIFDFYMVYAETDDFILIGNAVGISKPLLAKDTIIGWVPKERATAWKTREAVQFDENNRKDRKPAKIFQSLKGYQAADEAEVIGVEDYQHEFSHASFRFPVISKSEENNYYEVYYVGEVHTGDGEVVGAAQYEVAAEALKSVKSKLNGLQILIVVDATKSMEFAFAPIATAISKFTRNQLVKQYEVIFSLGVYRDVADGKSVFELKRFTDATQMENYLNTISANPTFARSHPDDKGFLEAVYQGIERSITQQIIKDQLLGVIVIGDHGGNDERVVVRAVNRNTHQSVIQALKQSRALFFPIQVATHPKTTDLASMPKVPTMQMYYDQMREILKDNNELDRKVVFVPRDPGEENSSEKYKKKLEIAIKNHMESSLDAIVKLGEAVTAKQQGQGSEKATVDKDKAQAGATPTAYGVKLSEILEKWLKQEIRAVLEKKAVAESPAQLEEMVEQQWQLVSKNRSQLFRKGYLGIRQANIPQVDEMVLVEKKNIVNLVSNFEKILNAFNAEPKERAEACKQTVLGILGEALPNVSEEDLRKMMEEEGLDMESLNRKMTGINFKGNNTLLTRRCDEWSSLDPIQMESDANRIRLSQDKLFKLLNNQESLWTGTEEPHPQYKRRNTFMIKENFIKVKDQFSGEMMEVDFRPRQYWWQRGGATYAWIPFNVFP